MTDKQFITCWLEVSNYPDRGAYVHDLALSSMWEDAPDAPIPRGRLEKLGEIWDARHRSFKDIAAASGMSNRKLAERFLIPYRTAENWAVGKRRPPLYVLMMMQKIMGLI